VDDIERARWNINYYEAVMPFGIVFLVLCLYSLIVILLRNRSYVMHNAYKFIYANLWLRYMINFFLPLTYYSAMAVRDKDVSILNSD